MNTCSVCGPLQPIWWRHKNSIKSAVLVGCVIVDEHGRVTEPPISFISVAVKRAVLQAAMWSFRNASPIMRNQLVKIKSALGKSLALSPAVNLTDAIIKKNVNENFFHLFYVFYLFTFNVFYLHLMNFINFLSWKISLISCLGYYLSCRRGNNNFDVHFRRVRPVQFSSKDGKNAVCEGMNGRKGVRFPPESAFSLYKFYD